MTPVQHARLMQLFDEACELPRPELPNFLMGLEGADAELARDLRDMLAADRQTQVFFDQTKGGAALIAKDMLESALLGMPSASQGGTGAMPSQVGEYDILEVLGAGGMGSVYRAHQRTPERIVALKMLHPWLISTASLERFRFEAQALASLKHPSIPPVYAVGQHEGAVYFAMELVHGPNLTAWASAQKLSVERRVELMVRICEAVHHAHLRGFVHRDLKPDNIRVPDDGVPRVLDFGISAGLGERAEVAGTPAYMSPEQLEPGAPVDVRSDVYALGIIAFELLAGRLPVVPPKSGLATLQALKKERAPRLASTLPRVNPDLDAIVAKALEVEPEQRYASVAELGDDFRRHLEFQPVRARATSHLYRFGRFVRRNRIAVSAVSAIAAALIVGAGAATHQYLAAERARAVALTSAERAKASLEFLTSVLQEADSDNAGGRGATIGQALDKASERLAKQALDPHVEAAVRASLANTYVGLGEWSVAEQQAGLALAAVEQHRLGDDDDLGEVYRVVAEVREEAGDTTGARDAALRGLALEEHAHGTGPHAHLSYSLHVAAIALREAQELTQALELHRRAVAMERTLAASTHATTDLADALDQYALTLVTLGDYVPAEAAHREALALNLATDGPSHQNAAIEYHHLAFLEFERGEYATSLEWLDKALAIRLTTLGPDHMRVGMQRYVEARDQLALGHVDAAAIAQADCLRIAKKAFGTAYGRYARIAAGQVLVWLEQGRVDEALALAQQNLETVSARFGPRHYVTAEAHSNHAWALFKAGRRDEAAAELTDAIDVVSHALGEKPRVTREARARLAEVVATPTH